MKATLEPYSFIADFDYQYTAPPLPTATVLGTTNLCSGDDTDIIIVLTGTGPWDFTYTDGTTPVNIVGTNTNPYIVTVSPIINTTYSVTAVSDAFGVGTDFGADAIIAVYTPATCSAGIDQTICEGSDVNLAGVIGGSAISATWSGGAGTYNPNNTTLNAVYTPSAGEILAGTVTLTLTTNDPLGPCSAASDDMTVTIDEAATCNAGPNQTICATEDVTLAGSIGGSAVSATWSGGAGTYNPNNTTLNAVYTPSAGEQLTGSVTLTLTTNDPIGPCPAVSDSILITINPQIFNDEPVVLPNGTAYLLCSNQLNLNLKESVEFEFWFYLNQFLTTTDHEALFEVQNNASNFCKIRIVPDNAGYGTSRKALRFTCAVASVADTKDWPTFFNIIPAWYKIKFVWTGTSLTVYKNGIFFNSVLTKDLNNILQFAGCDLYVLKSAASDFPIQANNKLFGFKYKTNGSLIVHYPICEESGNTVYNVVSNAYHLTGQSGFNALNWSRDNDQEKYLRDNGYRLSGGIYIPALLSGASAADGNALTDFPPCTEFN